MRKIKLPLAFVGAGFLLLGIQSIGRFQDANANQVKKGSSMSIVRDRVDKLLAQKPASVYDFDAKSLAGSDVKLSEYKDKVILIVNTASKCGFTSQYEGLEKLYKKYKGDGFAVLGFPCNQFGSQEPGSNSEIKSFCQVNYGVSFPMFSKIEVNGEGAHPLYKYLKDEARGAFNSQSIKWNFTKFLVDKNGRVLKRYAPSVKPESLASDIEKLLKNG